MIFGQLDEIKFYKGISHDLDLAFKVIEEGSYKTAPLGKNILNGDDAFFNVVEVETKKKEDCFFEIHKDYLDIHIAISGEEGIGYSEKYKTSPRDEYNETSDLQFLNGDEDYRFKMNENNFLVVFPLEPHKPLVAENNEVKKIKKAIFKIRVPR